MISQAQKIDCRAFLGEKYFRFFRNRIFQQNQLSRLTPDTATYRRTLKSPKERSGVQTNRPSFDLGREYRISRQVNNEVGQMAIYVCPEGRISL